MTATDRIVRLPEVVSRVGLSKWTVRRYIKAGLFPAPMKLGSGGKTSAVGWLDSEITAYLAIRMAR
jgi:prophage regulatory protein